METLNPTSPTASETTPDITAETNIADTGSGFAAMLDRDGLTIETLPEAVSELPAYLVSLLNVDARGVWPYLTSAEARRKLLVRAEKDAIRKAEATRRRIERETLCGEYIDALCRLPLVAPEEKEAARADFILKRDRYHALKGSK